MSNYTPAKHIINTPETLVSESIQGLCYANPNLRILEKDKVIYYSQVKDMASNQVTLVSGGGSGHEPGFASYVGKGGLAASVCGHVFASPSSSQVLSAIKKAQSPHGTLVIIMNYTGDCLNFGLAVERAKACGIKVDLIAVSDDIAVGRSKGGKVGRRGLAATALAIKLAGALASNGAPLDGVKKMVQYTIDNAATLGAALDHCHVPGSSSSFTSLDVNDLELGMGIHNETGCSKLEMMSTKDLVSKMIGMLVDQKDKDRAFLSLPVDKKTPLVVLVNNLGGMAQIELSAVVKEAVDRLLELPHVQIERVLVGSFLTSLNMPGFSISLLAVNGDLLGLLDQKSGMSVWPSTPAYSFSTDVYGKETSDDKLVDTIDNNVGQVVDSKVLEAAIRGATNAVIEAEPNITSYDTILGDGDCGQTLKTAALAVIDAIPSYQLSSGPKAVLGIADTIEHSVGGTSSAIYCIFFNALGSGLLKYAKSTVDASVWVAAARHALDTLMTYTKARVGDRTLMDTLCPFIHTLNDEGSNLSEAVEAARKGSQSTNNLSAKLGRTSYLSNEKVLESNVPDAGAYGLAELLTGMVAQTLVTPPAHNTHI
ncbi:hypothetical protein HPULCUR_003476 [Helicostylum pulchrum]|uniref:Uncharacterized protein n=1 Tax=Helicostylum pulchrum TaxID=562976 RepID=A0ABP9XTI3_9FUNG